MIEEKEKAQKKQRGLSRRRSSHINSHLLRASSLKRKKNTTRTKRRMRIALSHHSPLPGIRLVHRRDLARDVRPLHLAAQRAAAALALEFLPFEEFVAEARVGQKKEGNKVCCVWLLTYENLKCGWMMTFSLRARTKQ